jgi:hypothetical protein
VVDFICFCNDGLRANIAYVVLEESFAFFRSCVSSLLVKVGFCC